MVVLEIRDRVAQTDYLLSTEKKPPKPGRSDNIGKPEAVAHKHSFKISHRFCVLR